MRRDTKTSQTVIIFLVLFITLFSFALKQVMAQESSSDSKVIYQSQSSGESERKGNYYSKKILQNEINFLKEELEKQKKAHDGELNKQKKKFEGLLKKQKEAFKKTIKESSYPVIKDLETKLLKAEKDLIAQKKTHEQALVQKELEFNMKIKTLSDQFEKVVTEAREKSGAKESGSSNQKIKELSAKVDSLNEKLKIKENLHKEALEKQEKEYNERLEKILEESKTSQGMEREQEIGDIAKTLAKKESQVRVLEQRVKDLNEKLEREKEISEKELGFKEKEYRQMYEDLKKQYEMSSQEQLKVLEGKLNKKYTQLDKVIRDKERRHAEEIFKLEQELKKTQQEAQQKEATLRQLTASKELELGKSIEEEKKKYLEENQALKKSSEQLRMYIVKLKEELKTKSIIVAEKDNQVDVLNKKLALYSGEETSKAYQVSKVAREELAAYKKENERLKSVIEDMKENMAEQKSTFETRLAKQKKTIMNLQRDAEAEILNNSFSWEKKLRIQEAKYQKQIRVLEKENERLQSDYDRRLEKISEQLREKKDKDEKIKDKLSGVRENQIELLEEMLISKATMMQKVPPDFKRAQKDKAQVYFRRAMQAILQKNYARAKYELEEVLVFEPDNQMTKNMLGSIDFLLEKK